MRTGKSRSRSRALLFRSTCQSHTASHGAVRAILGSLPSRNLRNRSPGFWIRGFTHCKEDDVTRPMRDTTPAMAAMRVRKLPQESGELAMVPGLRSCSTSAGPACGRWSRSSNLRRFQHRGEGERNHSLQSATGQGQGGASLRNPALTKGR